MVHLTFTLDLVCEKREGDTEWLKKKCLSKTFVSKYEQPCRDLCNDDGLADLNPNFCTTERQPESIEEIVRKCESLDYYKDNKEKCQVVEKIDLVLEEQDSAANQKADIVESIQRKTEKERKSFKKQKIKNKKKKDLSKKKKKKNKKSEKVKKSKCNKPKYAATHHAECKKIDMKSVIAKKCLKKKYQNKHKMRCSFMARNDHPIKENEIFSEVIDKRCRKESFR